MVMWPESEKSRRVFAWGATFLPKIAVVGYLIYLICEGSDSEALTWVAIAVVSALLGRVFTSSPTAQELSERPRISSADAWVTDALSLNTDLHRAARCVMDALQETPNVTGIKLITTGETQIRLSGIHRQRRGLIGEVIRIKLRSTRADMTQIELSSNNRFFLEGRNRGRNEASVRSLKYRLQMSELNTEASDAPFEMPTPTPAFGSANHRARLVISWIWALSPLFPLGILAAPCIMYAQSKQSRPLLVAETTIYAALGIASFLLTNLPGQAGPDIGTLLWFAAAIPATVHALRLRKRLLNTA